MVRRSNLTKSFWIRGGVAAAITVGVAVIASSTLLHAAPPAKTYTSSFNVSCDNHGAATVNIYILDAAGSTLTTASMECTPGTSDSATATTSVKPGAFFGAWNTYAVVNGAWVASTPYDADLPHRTTQCATDPASGTVGCATVSR
jgi:hypothetical protein